MRLPIGFGFIVFVQVILHFALRQFVNSHPRGCRVNTAVPQAEADDFVENVILHLVVLLSAPLFREQLYYSIGGGGCQGVI